MMNYISITNSENSDSECINFFGKYLSFNLNYSLDYWDNYYDEKNGKHFFILGRPAVEVEQWSTYDNNPSYITRVLAKDFVKKNIVDFCKDLDGGFTVVVLDFVSKQMIIIRDKFGVYPIYFNNTYDINRFQIATHPDILAKYSTDKVLDHESVAEFLSQGHIMHPNTYYKNIKALDNASYTVCDFNTQAVCTTKYFDFTTKEHYDYKSLLNKLICALKKSIEKRTVPQYGKTAVLLSGGADSRTIINNAKSQVEAFTTYNVENRELETAQEVASILNIKHNAVKVNDDVNRQTLINGSKYSGGMSTPGNGTHFYFAVGNTFQTFDNLLSAHYADQLFKDIAFNTKTKTFFGKKIPMNIFDKFHYNYFGPNAKIEKLLNIIHNRKKSRYPESIRKNLNLLQIRRIIPLSNLYTSSSRLIMQRTLPWESVLVDNGVLEVLLEIPPKFKLNGRIYNEALGQLCKETKNIPHANTGVKIGAGVMLTAIIKLFHIINKKYFTSRNNKNYKYDTWGNTKETMQADVKLQEMFYSTSSEFQDYICSLLGVDIFKYSIKEIIDIDYHLFYNILTFYYWAKGADIVLNTKTHPS